MIIRDTREPDNIKKALTSKGIKVEDEFLSVGDYLLDDGFAIERKDKDFIQSILSNRLYDQLNNLCNYPHPILCIVEENRWKSFYFSHSKWIHKAYDGTMTTLAVSYPNLKIFKFDTEEEFINFVVNLDKKLHKEGKSERPSVIKRKSKSIQIHKEDCLTCADGVGVSMAKKLLECFGSVKNISNASLEELQLVDGVGKKLAENIFNTLN